MNLKNICIKINAFFCLGGAFAILWGYNQPTALTTAVALICLLMTPAAGLGWRTARTGRGLPLALFCSGAMIPYAVWLCSALEHVGFGFPGLLGLSNLCLLPILKKHTAREALAGLAQENQSRPGEGDDGADHGAHTGDGAIKQRGDGDHGDGL